MPNRAIANARFGLTPPGACPRQAKATDAQRMKARARKRLVADRAGIGRVASGCAKRQPGGGAPALKLWRFATGACRGGP